MKLQQVVQVFNKLSGVVVRIRIGQIKVVNMCSLRLRDTKPTWIHWVRKQETRDCWLLRTAICVIVSFYFRKYVFVLLSES